MIVIVLVIVTAVVVQKYIVHTSSESDRGSDQQENCLEDYAESSLSFHVNDTTHKKMSSIILSRIGEKTKQNRFDVEDDRHSVIGEI